MLCVMCLRRFAHRALTQVSYRTHTQLLDESAWLRLRWLLAVACWLGRKFKIEQSRRRQQSHQATRTSLLASCLCWRGKERKGVGKARAARLAVERTQAASEGHCCFTNVHATCAVQLWNRAIERKMHREAPNGRSLDSPPRFCKLCWRLHGLVLVFLTCVGHSETPPCKRLMAIRSPQSHLSVAL